MLSKRVVAVVGSVAVVAAGVTALPGIAAAAPGWSHQKLWSTDGTNGSVGAGVSGNGKKAVVVATGMATDWKRGRWGAGENLPRGDVMYGVDSVQLSRTGRTAFVNWIGDANEGIDDLYASVRVGSKWRTKKYGAGISHASLSRNGATAVVAWYDQNPDFGTTDHVYVRTWQDGSWSSALSLALPGGELGTNNRIYTAVSDGGTEAAVVWEQGGDVKAATWDGAVWSAPLTAVGSVPLAVRMAGAGQATVLTGRGFGVDQIRVETMATAPGGFTPAALVGDVNASSFYALNTAELDATGTGGLLLLDGAGASVATWSATSPFAVKELGLVFTAADLASRGGSALLTTMTDPTDLNASRKVAVRTWDGVTWSAAKKVGRCVNRPLTAAVSDRGTTRAAAWSCGHLHVARNATR